MMKKAILIIILLLMLSSLIAQQKSIRKAIIYSALVPGLGELYTKNYNKAAVFLTIEAATIFTYFRLKDERQWALNSYKQFAYSIAGVPKESKDWYYQILQDNQSAELFNEGIIRDARNYYLIYKNDPAAYEDYLNTYLVPEDMSWDWGNKKNWYKFRSLRRDKQNMEIYMRFAFAAAIVNRFVSLIDAAISAKNYNKEMKQTGQLSIVPDFNKGGFNISYEIKF
jgi:hypothetical protein